MKSIFTILVVALFLLATTTSFIFAHEEYFPHNWQDKEFHRNKILRQKNAIKQVRESRGIPLYHTRADFLRTNEKECVVCFSIADPLIATVMSNSGSAVIEDVVNGFCASHYANNTKDAALCKNLGDLLIDLLHKGLDELVGDLHFNVSNVLCADLLKLCIEPCCDVNAPYKPEQRRLAYADHKAVAPFLNMTVSWMTLNPTVGDVVVYSFNGGAQQNSSLNSKSHQYTYGGNVGYVHSLIIPNIPANTTVSYSVGSPKGMSDFATFTTLPLNVGTATGRKLRFYMTADMGIDNSSNTMKRLIEHVDEVDFWLHPGDMSYSDGEQRVWNIWGREIDPIVSKIPWVEINGNHELFDNFGPYRNRYGNIHAAPAFGGQKEGFYYHQEIGPLNLVMLNSETPINTADFSHFGQLEWLNQVLPEVTSRPGTLTIAAFHRPFYCSNGGSDCGLFGELLRSQAEETFAKYGVDLLFNGHMHDTEYTYPVKSNGQYVNSSSFSNGNFLFPEAPITFIQGLPGNREPISTFRTKEAWSAYQYNADFVYAIGELQQSVVGQATHSTLTITIYRSLTDEVVNTFSITSKR